MKQYTQKNNKSFLRTFLLIMVLISLLTSPYAFISYACYAGLCGGTEVVAVNKHPAYVTFLGYYSWLYPILVGVTLWTSRKITQQTKDFSRSISVLLLPGILLIPLGYIA